MPDMTVRWNAIMDRRTCTVCQHLDGYIWHFPVMQGGFPDTLIHPVYGSVWDMISDASLTHDVCRCHLEYEFDTSDITAQLETNLKVPLEQLLAEKNVGDEQ